MLDDYELLYLAAEKNEDAMKELLKKYYNLICYKAKKYSMSDLDIDDFINEGILCLYETIDTYTERHNTKFITYFNTCLDRKMSNYRKTLYSNKHLILNNSISLEGVLSNKAMIDTKYDPNVVLFNKEKYDHLKRTILSNLNSDEELVFILKEQNFSAKEISLIIDRKTVDIYNIIKKIRNKASKIVAN